MQGKEASEQETKAKSNVGIDVSKDWLDIHVLPAGEALRVANTGEGIRRLKRWLTRFNLALVVVEATGKWHRPLRRSLDAGAIPVAVVDPFRVRMFAKAQGILAKTDRLDARVLAQFAAVMAPPVRAPEPQMIEELRELVVARASAVEQQTALKNQRSAATVKFLQRQLDRRIARADQDIAALDAAILKRVKADDGLARRYAILTSIAGIGFVAAATLLASLPELGSSTVKQIAMLAGLAPIADQSGKRDGVRVVCGGRASVRRILYLAALTAMRFNTDMKAAYQRMTAAGKAPKLAIIAIARKLAVLANTLISQDRTWLPQPPKHA
jgi:transposase